MATSKIKEEIVKESRAFVKTHKGMKIDKDTSRAFSYDSPRVSSEYMDCSLPMTFDNLSYCSLGCVYCFAYIQKTNNPSFNTKLHSVNNRVLINTLRGKPPKGGRHGSLYRHFIKKRFVLHWGGLADPFCNFEKANNLSYPIIKVLAEEKYPTLFSFKGSAVFRPNFRKLFSKYAGNKSFAFQVSIIAPSDEMSREIEIGVPVTSKRIRAIKMLHDMGYWTILRLRPFIIGITDDGLDELLHRCKEAGIDAISTEFLALDFRSNEMLQKRYKWIGELIGVKDTLKYFKELSPAERGGYLRLNRLVKERFVKKIYKFCIENDVLFACSDPDFKELNMTSSCCGLPEKYKDNVEMLRYTRNQLTHHLKEARRVYHKDGRIMSFRFDKVYNPEQDTYLTSKFLANDHVVVSSKCASERQFGSYLEYARNVWNNLRVPGNPRNYFHGKIMPVKADENDNLIYVYKPSDYESRWIKEGIDLKK